MTLCLEMLVFFMHLTLSEVLYHPPIQCIKAPWFYFDASILLHVQLEHPLCILVCLRWVIAISRLPTKFYGKLDIRVSVDKRTHLPAAWRSDFVVPHAFPEGSPLLHTLDRI